MTTRTIAIGDIHGCSCALASLLDAIAPCSQDLLIVLGDAIDRGPDSRQVIDRLLKLQGQCRLVLLMGNHEWMMLNAWSDLDARQFWLEYGGRATLDSYGGRLEHVPTHHLKLLRGGLPSYETEKHLFVHANYEPETPLDKQPDSLRMWTHLDLRSPPPPHVSGKTVVVGHTPQLTGEVLDLGHLICIDTFCCGGGWLTALDVDTRAIWQTDRDGNLRQGRSVPHTLSSRSGGA